MGRIQASTGLVSGIDYTEIVTKLIELDSVPMNKLIERTDKLKEQQSALTELSTQLLTATYMIRNLAKVTVYDRRDLFSSDESVMKVTQNGTPVDGNYSLTSVRMAQSYQAVTSGVADKTAALGKTGTITMGYTRDLESNISLSDLNGGEGFQRGYIRLTDKSGSKANIDLRYAETMDDVIKAINDNMDIAVRAETDGYCITIHDESGGNGVLSVRDVSGGTTAKSLGLDSLTARQTGVDENNDPVYDDTIMTGKKIHYVGESTRLSTLNDGNGIPYDKLMNDIKCTLSDESEVIIDFGAAIPLTDEEKEAQENGEEVVQKFNNEQTMGDIIATINKAGNGKLKASLTADGLSLQIEDLSGGSGTFKMEETANNAGTLRALGFLRNTASSVEAGADGKITSGLLMAEMDSVLNTSLYGGQGLFSRIDSDDNGNCHFMVQDRSGKNTVLSIGASSLQNLTSLAQTVRVFNQAFKDNDLGLRMELNESKTGLNIVDTTGQTTSNIIFGDVAMPRDGSSPNESDPGYNPDAEQFISYVASAMGFGTQSSTGTLYGRNLGIQSLSYDTKLSEMKGGTGIDTYGGRVLVTDSAGKSDLMDFDKLNIETIGDFISAFNNLDCNVWCRVNDSGDGLVFLEFGQGGGSFSIKDAISSSTVAEQLGIDKTVERNDPNNRDNMTFSTSYSYKIEVEASDSLETIQEKINELDGGFTATIINDGTSAPWRLSINSKSTGSLTNMSLNFEALGLSTQVLSKGQDALVVYGDPNNVNSMLIASKTNTIKDVIPGMSVTLTGTSEKPISIWTERSSVEIKASLKSFVENYNTFRETFHTHCKYNDDGTQNILTNHSVTRKMDREYTDMIQKMFETSVYGDIRGLADLGIKLVTGDSEGKGLIEFDESKFDQAFSANPDAIKEFFAKERDTFETVVENGEVVIKPKKEQVGFATKFGEMADLVIGEEYASATVAINGLDTQILKNEERIEFLAQRLLAKRDRYLKQYYYMETVLAGLQSQSTAISNMSTGTT